MLEAKLTDREQRILEHLRRAEEQQMSLAKYARSAGVSASELYSGKQSLVRKGVIPGRQREADLPSDEPTAGQFVPIQVVPSNFRGVPVSGCQIRYPSGVIIECAELPPTGWILALMGRACDVAA
jgi:hypothetical protein